MKKMRVSDAKKRIIASIISISILIVLMLLMSMTIYNYANQQVEDTRYEVSLKYHKLVDEVQDFTNENISLLSGFSAYIQMSDEYTDEEIYSYLDFLLRDNLEDIRNIGIFQNTTIVWVYPLEGNEEAIGVDFSEIPEQAEAIMRVKENQETLFVGPINLVQGGIGFIIRMPLLKNNEYWGMVSIVLRAERAFEFIESYSADNDVDYLITHADQADRVIFGDTRILDQSPLKFRTEDSLGGWDVYTVPSGGWEDKTGLYGSVFTVWSIINVIISRYVYNLIKNYNLILKDKVELEKKYILDRLTGIYTREYFNLRVQETFSQALRHGFSISMIYFDLDHFKEVNDTYGHSTGDKVLLNIIDIVKDAIRNEDVFSRWGGDEFILLLPHTGLTEAMKIAERIRVGIETHKINQSYGVTASLGCSQWVEQEYIESWFARTDEALYKSKRTGKNKVTVSDHQDETGIFCRIEWDNKWNSGHPQIDEEHRKLLIRCNAIIESSLGKDSFEETVHNIEAFISETKIHFENEIAILRQVNYPKIDEHENIHDTLLDRVYDIYGKTVEKSIDTNEIFTFLLSTIVEGHLKTEDVKYFRYL